MFNSSNIVTRPGPEVARPASCPGPTSMGACPCRSSAPRSFPAQIRAFGEPMPPPFPTNPPFRSRAFIAGFFGASSKFGLLQMMLVPRKTLACCGTRARKGRGWSRSFESCAKFYCYPSVERFEPRKFVVVRTIPKHREWGRPRQGTPCCCLTKTGYVFSGTYIAS